MNRRLKGAQKYVFSSGGAARISVGWSPDSLSILSAIVMGNLGKRQLIETTAYERREGRSYENENKSKR